MEQRQLNGKLQAERVAMMAAVMGMAGVLFRPGTGPQARGVRGWVG